MERNRAQQDRDELPREGRDELNLAEFPIAVLSSRPKRSHKTVHFEDRIWDKGRDGWATRRLTISASDQYGLPTALDDEVILGLIQLTREGGFANRRVFFSRYRLIRLLGWRNEGKSYARLDTSLKRWMGVTLYYESAWWDKGTQSWVDESFHILERLSLYDRRRRLTKAGLVEPSLSLFAWNDVVFRSFQSGYLKQIDMALYRKLRSPITKRLYRLLDKRFYHKPRWQFDLREIGCEHIGLSRNYDIGQLKRKLRPAIAELESLDYLGWQPEAKRFTRIRDGKWQVSFVKGNSPKSVIPSSATVPDDAIQARLLQRGVNPVTAREIVAQFATQRIEHHIEVHDWLLQCKDRVPKNPAGYLVQSIRDGYDVPEDFEQSCKQPRGVPSHFRTPTTRARPSRDEKVKAVDAGIRDFLRQLDPRRRMCLEARALESADPLLTTAYHRAVSEGVTVLADVYKHLIVEKYLTGHKAKQHDY